MEKLTRASQFTEAQIREGIVAQAKAILHQPNHGNLYRDSSNPYNWPPAQFDCSVFVHWLDSKFGINPDQGARYVGTWPQPRPSNSRWNKYEGYTMTQLQVGIQIGSTIPWSELKPGCHLYYTKPGTSEHHVTTYIGGGLVIHAAATSLGVILTPYVPPGQYGHGGKKLVGIVDPVRTAKHIGVLRTVAPPKPAPKPAPVPPVTGGGHGTSVGGKPAPAPRVSLSAMVKAAQTDPGKKQGYATYAAGTKVVEAALLKEGLLDKAYAFDGSFGSSSIAAYAGWQLRCGYRGTDANGIPGSTSLVRLGRKYGFVVVA